MEQMFFWAGAFCTVLVGIIMYAFIMVIEYRSKFKMVNERLDFAIRQLQDQSESSWRMREDIVRQYNERMDIMERHAYEQMSKIETRIESLESKMIPKEAHKQVLKG